MLRFWFTPSFSRFDWYGIGIILAARPPWFVWLPAIIAGALLSRFVEREVVNA